MRTGRRAKNIIDQRFGELVVLSRGTYSGNNLRYNCHCDCGQECLISGQQLRNGATTSCPDCRSRKQRKSKEIELQERLKRLEKIKKIDVFATKYVLMNPTKTQIIRGKNGFHSYFCKIKARTAARVIGNAIVVPLEEALEITKG